jgi:hypothetical protein
MLAFADWSSTGTQYQVRYFSDVALPELHSNSVTAISFTADICTSDISPMSMLSLDSTVGRRGLHAHDCAGCHTAAAISMAFENMFQT